VGDPTTTRAGRRARRDGYLSARAEAIRTLEADDLDLVEAAKLLDSPWRGIRAMVVRALRKNGRREALPQLAEHASTEEDRAVRRSIALALADMPDAQSSETLWRLLDDESEDVRRLALRGLGRLGDERVVPIAVSRYQSGGLWVRAEAVGVLADLRTEAAKQALERLLQDERSWRRRRLIRRMLRSADRPQE
jgi:HEAT repeat protein